ncbi:hypothetical protein BABINDRAFT_161769 [Babjeviella inositovora NRRL Y-12698]|uniref:peptidyl-tRNA hydrolase n=1 Tax=Babjeviella inositovora NRRL Y-12698 TaxID=984486 RepID=A0A1E3QNU6_9ASCO|nr:uncharacterized protein BABINDRAFT_161769 [Babjeviella inositovora NRRL Y-12698]ODQ79363.1 hypothetical protein BABINDRAFT_161769 [Babjeviella inositovora NRRL Y-12698]
MLFVRTQSYMNVSGAPISRIWNAVKQLKLPQVSSLVVIHDELSIPVGKVQVRKQFTSARGHNGLRSISENIGGGYTKIGIGIGKPTNGEVADYVLTRFNKQDLATIEMDTIPQVVSIIEDMKMGRYIYEVSENIMGEEKKKKKKAKKLRKIDLEMEGPGA